MLIAQWRVIEMFQNLLGSKLSRRVTTQWCGVVGIAVSHRLAGSGRRFGFSLVDMVIKESGDVGLINSRSLG
jgi:hypothetical protein